MTTGKSIVRAAGFVMIFTLIARILGFVREMVIYTWFGQSYATDAYNAAFSVPDLIYMLMVGGALSTAFIPVFSRYLANNEDGEAWKVASIVFNYTITFCLILIAVGVIYTRPLIMLLAPDLPPDYINLTILLTRVMFIQTFFMVLSGISMGVLNSKQHFTTPALGAVLYNVGIIGIGILMARYWGIMAFSIGVVVGAAMGFIVQIPALMKSGVQYSFNWNYKHPGFKQILYLMAPVLLGLSVSQINLFITQNLASGLAEGSISALKLSQRIMQLPVGIFGTSIATVIFPTMTAQMARREIPAFRRTFSLGMRAIMLISIPASMGLIALREPIIQLLFQQGQFTASNTQATAEALLWYSIGLFAYSSLQIMNRVFYSMEDTITPVIVAIISVAVNVGASLWLIESMQHGGLALAFTISGITNLLLLLAIFKWRLKSIDGARIMRSVIISTGASLVMYFVVQFVITGLTPLLYWATKLNQLIIVSAGIGIGITVYAIIIILFRLEETQLIMDMLKRVLPGGKKA
ncbi:MAG: murein biosynthesis integral membrane protein MurJ [Syntrophomonadaceae bacterium]|nr:murein biosynthesis integral membrane protein MurJ [Syntrophomonadaceae bacterium]